MIRWIRDWLGTAPYAETLGDGAYVLDVRHLIDKQGNSSGPIKALIDEGVRAAKAGQKLIVACDYGISRSNSVAAGILSCVEKIPFDQAARSVIAATGEAEIKVEMLQSVRSALGLERLQTSPNTILVTGSSGFLGTALVARLGSGHKVLSPSRNSLDLTQGEAAFADYCAGENVGQIVHLAYPRIHGSPAAAGQSMSMLRAVLNVCRALRIRLVFVSSAALYGDYDTGDLAVHESTPFAPKGSYGEAMYLEEVMVDLYHRRGDIDRSVCRFTTVYGPGGTRPRFLKNFHQAARHNDVIRTHVFRNGRPALDLLYISDAADGLAKAIAGPSDVFHFGTGSLQTTAELAELVARHQGVSPRLEEIPMDESIGNIKFPSLKARRILEWCPSVSIKSGLAQTLSSM